MLKEESDDLVHSTGPRVRGHQRGGLTPEEDGNGEAWLPWGPQMHHLSCRLCNKAPENSRQALGGSDSRHLMLWSLHFCETGRGLTAI